MTRRAVAGALGLLTLLPLVGSCGLLGGSDGAPASFTEREPLPACDPVRLGQGETVPDDAWACLENGLVEGAELVVEAPTTEGDPITTYYRVGPSIDGMEIFTDGTADTFGPGTWTHQLCPDTEDPREPLGCTGA
jgi:hypothetical protein